MNTIRLLIIGLISFVCWSQNTTITGYFVDQQQRPISNVRVAIPSQATVVYSNQKGFFTLSTVDVSTVILNVSHPTYAPVQIPVNVTMGNVELSQWVLREQQEVIDELPIVDFDAITATSLAGASVNFGSQLRSRRTVFLEALSFQFSSAFFSARGLARKHQSLRINGIPMQNFDTGNASWAHWGGLNDITNRSQTVQYGVAPFGNYFAGLLGGVELFIRPSTYRQGNKFSQAFSNRTYRYRTMFSSHSGARASGWSYSGLLSLRHGNNGFFEGTNYQSYSGLIGVEKNWNEQNSTWLTAWWTPTQRGRSAPLTQEVFELKGKRYNPYWGIDRGKMRNSRVYRSSVPYFILNHAITFSPKANALISLGFAKGNEGNSRLSYTGVQPLGQGFIGGGRNPDPVYYQNLPSYFLREHGNPFLDQAYLADQNLQHNGQIDWTALRFSNSVNGGDYARYMVYEDQKKESNQSFAVRLFFDPSAKEFWNTSFSYQKSHAIYFAQPIDFLGSSRWYDVNPYANGSQAQFSHLDREEHTIALNQPFQYHYAIATKAYEANTLWSKEVKNWRFYLGGKLQIREYQRKGLFRNGGFPNNSLGDGKPVHFQTWNLKSGVQWSITGRHVLSLNGFYFNEPPSLRSIYPNPRESHHIIQGLLAEKSIGVTGQYHWQTPHLDFIFRPYWIKQSDKNAVSFYFADGVGGDEAFFIQEVLQGIQTQHQGLEFGAKVTFADLIDIKAAGAFGLHQYANAPALFLYTAPTETAIAQGFEGGVRTFGKANLKGNYLPNGPQQAYSLGIQYNDPAYWRVSVTGNYFSHAYLQPNPLKRTPNFLLDPAGLPIPLKDSVVYRSLLLQEQFPAYFLLNASFGKSWKVKQDYIGFFATLENLLNTSYITGGFEQGRNANFNKATEDAQRGIPLFSPKYWWGRGTTFFSSLYYRF